MRRLCEALPLGRQLVISDASFKEMHLESCEHEELFRRMPYSLKMRSRRDIERYIGGFDPVDSGVIFLSHWHLEGSNEPFLKQPA